MANAGKLLCMGNPLLDISAVVTQEFLDKYSLKLDNQILIETDEQRAIFPDMTKNFEVEYIAGGATQNSARVAQWMLGDAGAVTYMGCVGKDDFSAKMLEVAQKDGMVARYMEDESAATGSCAVCVVGGERSLAANLAAANNYKVRACAPVRLSTCVPAAATPEMRVPRAARTLACGCVSVVEARLDAGIAADRARAWRPSIPLRPPPPPTHRHAREHTPPIPLPR